VKYNVLGKEMVYDFSYLWEIVLNTSLDSLFDKMQDWKGIWVKASDIVV
jgi:hypothetical protein